MRGIILALALMALLAPAAAAGPGYPVEKCFRRCAPQDDDVNEGFLPREGPVNVILYAHVEDILNLAPLNTMAPDPSFETDVDRGYLTPAFTAPYPGARFRNNEFRAFICPGPVERTPEGWMHNCHSGDLGAAPRFAEGLAWAYLYLSPDAMDGPGPTDADSGAIPQLRVSARLEEMRIEGSRIVADRVIAEGSGAPTDMVVVPGMADVYEFPMPLTFGVREPRAENGRFYMLTFSWDQLDAGGATATQSNWQLRTGPRFMPRLILPLENPLVDAGIEVEKNETGVYVLNGVRSPLGSYDVDAASMRIEVEGPTPVRPDEVTLVHQKKWSARDHSGTGRPITATWRLDPAELRLAAGEYAVSVYTANRQGTALLVQTTTFEVAGFDGSAIPVADLGWLLVGCGAAATIVRSRRR